MRSLSSARASPASTCRFLALDELTQIGLGTKAHRRAGPVIEIGGVGDEPLARFLDEGDVHRGTKHRIAQLPGPESFERIVEGQRVQEDGAGNVDCVGRQADVILGVDFLGQGLLSDPAAGDIVGDRRHIGGLSKAGDDLLADRLMARVDMVEVDRGSVSGLLFP